MGDDGDEDVLDLVIGGVAGKVNFVEAGVCAWKRGVSAVDAIQLEGALGAGRTLQVLLKPPAGTVVDRCPWCP